MDQIKKVELNLEKEARNTVYKYRISKALFIIFIYLS